MIPSGTWDFFDFRRPPPNCELFPTETWDFFDFLKTPPPIWTNSQVSLLFRLERFPKQEDVHNEHPGQLTDPDKVRNAKDLLDAADYVDDSPRNHADRNLINFDWTTFDPSRMTDWFSYCSFERFFFNRHF